MINGRRKGGSAENEVCIILSRWHGYDSAKITDLPFRRRFTASTPLSGDWIGAGDILHSSAIKNFPYCVEVKHYALPICLYELFNDNCLLLDWWDQCVTQARSAKKAPLLFFRSNRAPWLCMVEPRHRLTATPADSHIDILGKTLFPATLIQDVLRPTW